jgi:hypothetical protein
MDGSLEDEDSDLRANRTVNSTEGLDASWAQGKRAIDFIIS